MAHARFKRMRQAQRVRRKAQRKAEWDRQRQGDEPQPPGSGSSAAVPGPQQQSPPDLPSHVRDAVAAVKRQKAGRREPGAGSVLCDVALSDSERLAPARRGDHAAVFVKVTPQAGDPDGDGVPDGVPDPDGDGVPDPDPGAAGGAPVPNDLPWYGLARVHPTDPAGHVLVCSQGVEYRVPCGSAVPYSLSRVVCLLEALLECTAGSRPAPRAAAEDSSRPPTVAKPFTVFRTVSLYSSEQLFLADAVRCVLNDAQALVSRIRARALQLLRVFVGVAHRWYGEIPEPLGPHLRYIVNRCFRYCSPASHRPNNARLDTLPAVFHVLWEETQRLVAGVWAPFSEDDVASLRGMSVSLNALADHTFHVDLRGLLDDTREQIGAHIALQCGVPSRDVDALLDGDLPGAAVLEGLTGADVFGTTAREFVLRYHSCRDPAVTARHKKKKKKTVFSSL